MRTRRFFLHTFSILFILFPCVLPAQTIPPPPIEWGEIPRADLEMTSYPKDSSASAVVLCDYGETKLQDNFNLKYTRHLRVKILNEKGFRWGTMSISVDPDRENGDYVDEIEGVTYVLDPQGKVKELELDEDDIFEEEVSQNVRRHKFTLPGLTPGCIVEIRISIISKSLFGIRGWVFQDDDPVLMSEYRLIHPSAIVFAVLTRGYEKMSAYDHFETKMHYSGDVASYYGNRIVDCRFWRWVMKDIPAMRTEPYITTVSDYTSRIDLQLSGYAMRGGGVQRVISTWEQFVEDLMKEKNFGKVLADPGDAEDIAKALTDTIRSPYERMKAIHRYVSSNITWNGRSTMWATQKAEDLLESKKGSSADINYLLVVMLRAAGIQADPMILSTRSNGQTQELYPILGQFNYGVARAVVGGTAYPLDATNPLRPFDLLPAGLLGVRAYIVDPQQAVWTTITSPLRGISTVVATMNIQADGAVRGSINGLYKNYFSHLHRSNLSGSTPEAMAKQLFSLNASGLTLDSVEVVNKDSGALPFILKASVSSEAYAQNAGNLLYINPHMISRYDENPFKNPIRKFPVDYNYPREYTTVVTLILPDSFEVKELIPDRRLPLGNDLVYSRRMQTVENHIQLISKLEIINPLIPAANYSKLRELYDQMIHAETEQIVLQKKAAPVPPPPAPAPAVPEPKKTKKTAAAKKK